MAGVVKIKSLLFCLLDLYSVDDDKLQFLQGRSIIIALTRLVTKFLT